MSKILIVEDEEAIADLEKDYLELNDFEVKILPSFCKTFVPGFCYTVYVYR